nr:hypothetical protein [Tanacetum cinerariifolium]
NYAHRGYNKQHASFTKTHPQKHIVPAIVLTKSKLVSVTAARPVSAVVPKIMGNPQYALKDKGVIESGCSQHMTGNMSYLFDFQELNGGYVAFGDYSLWEVIINGDSSIPTVVIEGAVRPATILSADQKLARRNELKARGTLLIALP